MTRYRIYTENRNRRHLIYIVGEYFTGFTVFEAVGYWKGHEEGSLCFEILTDTKQWPKIIAIAERIKRDNKQESVLVTEETVPTYLL